MSFCFKLKAKRVGKIVSMVSFKDRSKGLYETVRVGKVTERLKRVLQQSGLGLFLIKNMLKFGLMLKRCKFSVVKKILLKKKLFKTVRIIEECVVLFTWYLF